VIEPDTEADEQLVQRSRQGDRAAFEQLVRRTARLVYARMYLSCADRHRAEDLTQEVFLTAWRSIGQVTRAQGFRPWLMTVASSVSIDAARRAGRKKRSAAAEEWTEGLTDEKSIGPAEAAERDEQRRRVLEVVQGLPEEYRRVVMLRYLAGADYETMERQLGLTNGALRGLLNRGMAMLRERMRQQ
jgi:RNA polymerase sigma-70 factor, ECF subfamily